MECDPWKEGVTRTPIALGIAQQTLAHYEGGKLRVAAALLPQLAQTLGTTVEELLGAATKRAGKRGPTPKPQQQIERLSRLLQTQQRVVMQMLEGFLNQAARSS